MTIFTTFVITNAKTETRATQAHPAFEFVTDLTWNNRFNNESNKPIYNGLNFFINGIELLEKILDTKHGEREMKSFMKAIIIQSHS